MKQRIYFIVHGFKCNTLMEQLNILAKSELSTNRYIDTSIYLIMANEIKIVQKIYGVISLLTLWL